MQLPKHWKHNCKNCAFQKSRCTTFFKRVVSTSLISVVGASALLRCGTAILLTSIVIALLFLQWGSTQELPSWSWRSCGFVYLSRGEGQRVSLPHFKHFQASINTGTENARPCIQGLTSPGSRSCQKAAALASRTPFFYNAAPEFSEWFTLSCSTHL